MSFRPQVLVLPETASSNQYGLEHFTELGDGTLVLAERQTAGRGRQGHVWHSPEGGLYASWIVKEFALPSCCAAWLGVLAVLELVRETAPGLQCGIKWPNDLLCDGRKISGVLCESKVSPNSAAPGMLIGIGLNVTTTERDLSGIAGAGTLASSLLIETGCRHDVRQLAASLAKKLSSIYETAVLHGQERLYSQWKSENIFLGRNICIKTADGSQYQGVAEDIGIGGELVLSLPGGGKRRFHSGEASLRPA